jgi:hypothetical protein
MIFDIYAEEGTPERRRARYVAKVLIDGVDDGAGYFYADTESGEMRRLKRDEDGQIVVTGEGEDRHFVKETVYFDPASITLVPKDECPTELRWS